MTIDGTDIGADRTEADQGKRVQILEGARAAFLARGFEAASMGEIARTAGVSKGTLYVYFDSKEALFAALIAEMHDKSAERLQQLESHDREPAEVLYSFGRGLMEKLSDPSHVAIVRVVIGASERFPQLARSFYEAGPAYGARRLAAFLEAETTRGHLTVKDPQTAAWQFLGMCNHPLVFSALVSLPLPDLDKHAAAAVESFMAAHGPRK